MKTVEYNKLERFIVRHVIENRDNSEELALARIVNAIQEKFEDGCHDVSLFDLMGILWSNDDHSQGAFSVKSYCDGNLVLELNSIYEVPRCDADEDEVSEWRERLEDVSIDESWFDLGEGYFDFEAEDEDEE